MFNVEFRFVIPNTKVTSYKPILQYKRKFSRAEIDNGQVGYNPWISIPTTILPFEEYMNVVKENDEKTLY